MIRISTGKEKGRNKMRKTNVSIERLPEAEITELQVLKEGIGGRGQRKGIILFKRHKC